MNTTAAAITAGVTIPTIRTWCRTGVIAAVKQAGQWVIDETSLRYRIALGAIKTRKEAAVTTSKYADLIRRCETRADFCTGRLTELDKRGPEGIGCSYFDWSELTGSYARAAEAYRHMARALERGDTRSYQMVSDSSYAGALMYDKELTGDNLPELPRRRDMNLPQA